MGIIYFISPVAYGMNPVFMVVVGTFIFRIQHLGLGKSVVLMAADNFEEELMMGYVLDELPAFVRKLAFCCSANTRVLAERQNASYNTLVMDSCMLP